MMKNKTNKLIKLLIMLVKGYNKNDFLAEVYTSNRNNQFFTENHIVKYVDSNKVKNTSLAAPGALAHGLQLRNCVGLVIMVI